MQLATTLRPHLALLLLGLAWPVSCGGSSEEGTSPSATAGAEGFPLELRASDGAISTLDAPATRVLPANATALDLVVAIGGPGKVGAFVGAAQDWSVACQLEGLELREDQLIGKLDMEAVVVADVDLIVTHAWQATEQRPLLERAGVPAMEIPEVLGRDELETALLSIGRALDEVDAARTLLESLLARLDSLGDRDRSHWSVMNLSYGGNGGWSAGTGTTADTVLRWAGARNTLGEDGRSGHQSIDLETLVELDPDALLIGDGDDGSGGSTLAFLRDDPRVQDLQAVKHGRLIVLPGTLYGTASHHLVQAAELVARHLDMWELDELEDEDQ